jgi:serine/threonine-protein kinase RsbW
MHSRLRESLKVPATLSRIDDVRRWSSGHMRAAGVDDQAVGELELAITEAMSNAIRHSYGEDHRQLIELSLAIDPSRIEFTILDRGAPFVPGTARTSEGDDPDSFGEGGYGLGLLEQLTDELSRTQRPDGATAVTLVRHRKDHNRQ